ncbi:MAG: nicotinate-nucleotide diphosphorylase (carboxylating) [Bacteroidetes bacterium GWF2_43_63]|nr:MAG: nicotinate-nucleotide diphosphorylase (carboxylating) [Bacteroidetes bacterium GWE2_42_42]OFY53313.1 MAG: nicotinate-nucleotide diphosphorylase (carboxylating) [Bacteroidetes bacterium GWF2_43_63]HBG71692.1 carboxylating nicotinate-nucleotide diphosphorylase [Bacteroidales bacterium]HCB61643.1 carboxylating nicotinate-nucleotide diphosphorylase [Bacteroidales bacterium]HCY22855.1 carboxylating nicotinate-nucleotide diphosphorylase [Bacteroidales bacterium]
MHSSLSIEQIIDFALKEDIGPGDHTTLSTVPAEKRGKMALFVKEEGILAGIDLARQIFHHYNPDISMQIILRDGSAISKGDIAFLVEGPVQNLLTCERLVLNFMQRLSGIATQTSKMVKMLEGTNTKILDTRKTTPLLRELEKMAVRIGGGHNHRFGLFDMILIKDNHVDFAGGITKALNQAKQYLADKKLDLEIEIEVRDMEELKEALDANIASRILIDNFKPDKMKEAVAFVNGRVKTEASGGITIDNLREYAETGVDFISSGALTHHIKSLDLSLKALD